MLQGHFSFELRHERLVREAFERYAINRVRDYMYRAQTNPRARLWMTPDILRQFEEWIGSPVSNYSIFN